jgi:hypothetical protein
MAGLCGGPQPALRQRRPTFVHLTRIAVIVGMTIALAACGSAHPTPRWTPSASASAELRPPTACVGVDEAHCQEALAILGGRLDSGVPPSYVQVSSSLCDGPCPGDEHGAWRAHLTVEFGEAREPLTILLAVDGNTVAWQPIETVLVRVAPRSAGLTAPAIDFTLGHCGLASGIDVDGALWVPVGLIEASDPELINSSEARFSLTSPRTAMLQTAGGTAVQLVRHEGPRFLPACD